MLTESEKRAAFRAVSRYASDPGRLKAAFHAAFEAHVEGDVSDLLDFLVREGVLSQASARELLLTLSPLDVDNQPPAAPGPTGDRPPPAMAPTMIALEPSTTKAVAFREDEDSLHEIGRYRILRKIGQGGMCPVYLAYDDQAHTNVAIKVLPLSQAVNQMNLDRFFREAKSGSLLNHPNIVRNLAFGQDQSTGLYYLVLEYVDGPSALNLLQQHSRLSVADALNVTLGIARGLEHAHSRNVIHRDIKPDNILLTRTGVAKLADMGLAKRTDEASHLTAARQGFGTPYYMPYEQAVNARHVDGRGDIYALGATLYHLVTGEVPFPGDHYLEILDRKSIGDYLPASVVNPVVPPVLDEILELMLARDPADRYQTVSELIVDLERSNLAAVVPSFADADLAYQDPVVRQRLAVLAQPTRADLGRGPDPSSPAKVNPDIWYLRYRVRKTQWCKTKATTRQVLRRIREGRLPLGVEAAHQIDGPFQPLESYAEFATAVRALRRRVRLRLSQESTTAPQETPVPSWRGFLSQTHWTVWAGAAAAVGLLGYAGFLLYQFLLG